MTKLPVLRAREVIKALRHAGFFVHHQKGSHVRLRSAAKPTRNVTVPSHGGDVPMPTLRRILEQAEISLDDFMELL